MAGSVNTAAQRPQSVNIMGIIIRGTKLLRAPR